MADSVFWMTSTLAQCIAAIYGLYLVYYVFAMNSLRDEIARRDTESTRLKEKTRGQRAELEHNIVFLGQVVGRLRIRESEVGQSRRLFYASFVFLAVISGEMSIMLSTGLDAPTLVAAIVGWFFLTFVSSGFMVVGGRQTDRSRAVISELRAQKVKLLSLLRKQGYGIKDLLKHEYSAFNREDFSDP